MICTYFRSSSYGCHELCPFSYFLQYGLGMRSPSNKKADLGNVVHKALELLARKKLAMQRGELNFREEELGHDWETASFGPEDAIREGYRNYSTKQTHHTGKNAWCPDDFDQCRQWMYDCMEMSGGLWNPLTRTIVQPEQYFDMEIDQPWANYKYETTDGIVEGKLAIKGTVDLITEVSPGVIEYLDWKTGRRWDWAHDKVKTWDDLRNDPQLRMYHYALTKLYPDAKQIIMTIVFIQGGNVVEAKDGQPAIPNRGAFSMPYCAADLPKTEQMLREKFEEVKETVRPKLNKSWKCKAFCHFGRNKFIYPSGIKSPKTICQHLADEVRAKGIDRVVELYGVSGAHSSYGDGGGQSNRDEKKVGA